MGNGMVCTWRHHQNNVEGFLDVEGEFQAF
jgi:hypothetical protein